jgi:hypothetical protein
VADTLHLPNAHLPLASVDAELVGAGCVGLLQKHLLRLHAHGDHPNRALGLDQMFVTLLIAYRQPCDRTLRLMDDLSQADSVAGHLPSGRSARSTMSDALAAFDPRQLDPLLADLALMLPGLQQTDPDLHALVNRQIRIADGSVFTVPVDVAWAIAVSRRNQAPGRQLRLNLQLDMVRSLPACFSVSGEDDGSETAAFARDLAADVIYVADRNFIDFKFLHAVLDKQSDFVVRAKASHQALSFTVLRKLPLSDKDIAANVLSDRIGYLPGSAGSPGFGMRLMREVVVHDFRNNTPVRLISSLADENLANLVAAYVIAHLYRRRWDIELFFRWLKCVAKFEHLFSHSRNGVSTQFYLAIIMALLSYINVGRAPGKYEFLCLGWVANGIMSAATMEIVLARRQREREQNRTRYRAKRAGQLAATKKSV